MCCSGVAIAFPVTAERIIFALVCYKANDIFQRITKENANLVRELCFAAKAPGKMIQALLQAALGVTFPQQVLLHIRLLQAFFQALCAVDINQIGVGDGALLDDRNRNAFGF